MANKVKIFTQPDCKNCPPAKQLAEELEKEGKIEVELYDIQEADGLAEAQIFGILATPSTILCDKDEEEIKGWRGKTPNKEELTS